MDINVSSSFLDKALSFSVYKYRTLYFTYDKPNVNYTFEEQNEACCSQGSSHVKFNVNFEIILSA